MKPLLPPLLCLFLAWSPVQGELRVEPLAEPSSALTGSFSRLDAETTGIDLAYRFPQEAPFELMTDQYSGNGVCVGDVDGDGLPDVFLTHYNQGNRLYRNLGDLRLSSKRLSPRNRSVVALRNTVSG